MICAPSRQVAAGDRGTLAAGLCARRHLAGRSQTTLVAGISATVGRRIEYRPGCALAGLEDAALDCDLRTGPVDRRGSWYAHAAWPGGTAGGCWPSGFIAR